MSDLRPSTRDPPARITGWIRPWTFFILEFVGRRFPTASMQRNAKDSSVVPFHSLLATALVSGAGAFNGNSAGLSGTRLPSEADAWAHFRIKSLRFRIIPDGAITGRQVVGWVGGVEDTVPATTATALELVPSTIFGARATVPTEWVSVRKEDLAGPLPWYKTVQGTADSTEEMPGQLVITGNGTDTVTVEVRGVFEYKTSVSTANTPAAIAARLRLRQERLVAHQERERARLLAVLATTAMPK